MNIPHVEVRKNNTLRVYLKECTIEYSYQEPIAFKFTRMPWVVHKNQWGTTTGRHINAIEADKRKHVSREAFKAIWKDATEGILKDMMYSDDPAHESVIHQRVAEIVDSIKPVTK
jgi:hypothetical protein